MQGAARARGVDVTFGPLLDTVEFGEVMANTMLAKRHLEDAVYRVVKALTT